MMPRAVSASSSVRRVAAYRSASRSRSGDGRRHSRAASIARTTAYPAVSPALRPSKILLAFMGPRDSARVGVLRSRPLDDGDRLFRPWTRFDLREQTFSQFVADRIVELFDAP